MKKIGLVAVSFWGMFLIFSALAWTAENKPGLFDHAHSAWSRILKNHVMASGAASLVNYAALKKNPVDLDAYMASIEHVSTEQFATFTENQKLAFLINAYNALTIKLVVEHYPVKSIKDIGGLFSSPWKIKFFSLFGEKHGLDDIEHDMIRKIFNEPRIHFALVCASKGCPALRNEAYIADKLDEQLESAARAFLHDFTHNQFDPKEEVGYLSGVFRWYGEDFEKKFGSVKEFVAPRMAKNTSEEAAIKNPRTQLKYLNYDWSLNDLGQ